MAGFSSHGRRNNSPMIGELYPTDLTAPWTLSPGAGGCAWRFYCTMTMPARVPLGISSGRAPEPMG
jgi:hypothetical protein